jgi:hypothetical protein
MKAVTGKTKEEVDGYYPTPWSRVLLEKPVVTQLFKKFLPFMEPDGLLKCSEDSTTFSYSEADESHPCHPLLCL